MFSDFSTGFGFFLAILFYIVPVLIIIWFMVSVVSSLRERNRLLKELIKKLDNSEVKNS